MHPDFNNKFQEEHQEYFEKLNELNKMRNELVYEHRKLYHESHGKQFNEFKKIHRYLRWMRPTGLLISIVLIFRFLLI